MDGPFRLPFVILGKKPSYQPRATPQYQSRAPQGLQLRWDHPSDPFCKYHMGDRRFQHALEWHRSIDHQSGRKHQAESHALQKVKMPF